MDGIDLDGATDVVGQQAIKILAKGLIISQTVSDLLLSYNRFANVDEKSPINARSQAPLEQCQYIQQDTLKTGGKIGGNALGCIES